MTILVTGASGHLGANLVRRLLDYGLSVRVLLLEGDNNAAVDGLDVEIVYGDLRDLPRIKTAVKGCDRIYHCAAKDIVEGHILAMKQGRPGQKYIFSSQFLTVDELMDMFEEITHRDRPSLRIPGAVMARVANVSDFILPRFFPDVPRRFTSGAIRILRMYRHADISKAENELGYQPTDMKVGIQSAYDDFLRRGLVT